MKRTMTVLLLGACLALPLAAEDAAAAAVLDLDLKTAVSLAEKSNLTLKGGQADLTNKKTAAETAWSVFYPTASLTGTFSAGVTDPASPSASRNKLSAGLTAGIVLDPTLVFAVKKLWNDYSSGIATLEQAKAKLASDVKKYYFSLLLQERQIALLQSQAEAARRRFEAADFRYQNGFLSETDKLTVEYALQDKLYTLQTTQNSYATNRQQLLDVCGLPAGREVRLTDALPDIAHLTPAADVSVDKNLDLTLLNIAKAQTEIQRDLAVAALLPIVSVSGSLGGGYSTDPIANPLFDAAAWSWDDSLGLTVKITVPLDGYLPFSSAQRSLAAQNTAVEKASYAVADRVQALRRQASSLLLTLEQTARQIEALQLNIELARKTFTLTEQLYAAGKKSFLDLKDAENSLANAQLQLLSAQNSYLSSYLDLQYLLNTEMGL